MKTIDEVYEKLNEIEQYSGIGGVALFLLIAILLFGFYHFLKNHFAAWGQSEIKRNLEAYKNELNTQLGQTLITSFSEVNKEIASIKSELNQSNKKELGYHEEKVKTFRIFFDSFVLFLNETTDPHHGGVDQWDQDELRKRVAKISGLKRDIDINIGKLKLYTDDFKFLLECQKISKVLTENTYTPPKQFLLKIRAWLPEYKSKTIEVEMKESLEVKNKLCDEYNTQLVECLEIIREDVESFYGYFRKEYAQLLKNE